MGSSMVTAKHTNGPVILVSKDIVYAMVFSYAYLAGYLRQMGETVEVWFRPGHPAQYKEFAEKLIAAKPLLVGFGTIYPDLYAVEEIVTHLDAMGRDFPVVIGGQMVSATPEFAVDATGADIGIDGEGELILHDLVQTLRQGGDVAKVKGLIIRDGDTVLNTGPGDYIKDLTQLPPIPYDLFPSEKWLPIGRFYANRGQVQWRYDDRVVSLHGGRGCPFKCSFCYHASKARYRPIAHIMEEAQRMIREFNANMLYFGDDLVLASAKRATEMIEHIRKLDRKISYSVSARFDLINRLDDSILEELAATGCRIMGLGIESGSQRMLDLMNKRITVEQIRNGMSRLHKAGILPATSIMVGNLDETREDVEMSRALMLDLVRENKNLAMNFSITTPFPGTDIYTAALERGLIRDHRDFYDRFRHGRDMTGLTINLSQMGDDEVQSLRDSLEADFQRTQSELRGPAVTKIERRRSDLYDSFTRWRDRFEVASVTSRTTRPLYLAATAGMQAIEPVYHRLQRRLDRQRLELYGVA